MQKSTRLKYISQIMYLHQYRNIAILVYNRITTNVYIAWYMYMHVTFRGKQIHSSYTQYLKDFNDVSAFIEKLKEIRK